MYDDYFVMEFDPGKIDYGDVVASLGPVAAAFGAYQGRLGNEEFAYHDRGLGLPTNGRHAVHRVHPISFFDTRICEEAIGAAPHQIAERLRPIAEDALSVESGVLIIGAKEPLAFDEALKLSDRLTQGLFRQ